MNDSRRAEHWARTRKLMFITLTIWFIFSFVVHWFAPELNSFTMIGGWPLGFYMAAQGSEIIFVVTLFWFARQQHNIDRDCGFAEEE